VSKRYNCDDNFLISMYCEIERESVVFIDRKERKGSRDLDILV
jgi:hypothetical protein